MNNRILRVLRIKPFLYLWLAEIFSQIAMNMVNFVLIIVAYKISNSNAAVSGIVLSFTIPAILFGMVAGVFVDRWNKKTVLFATNAIRTLLLITLAFMHTDIVMIYLLSFAIAIVTQFFIPAETPMIPILVKKDLLYAANALFGMGIYGSLVVAYVLSGSFLIFFGDTYVFLVLAVIFALAAFFVTLICAPEEKLAQKPMDKAMFHALVMDIKHAFSVIFSKRDVFHSLVLLTLSQLLILLLAVIGPGFAKQIMNIPVDTFPLLFVTPAALGMVIGGIIIGNYFHNFSKQLSATIGVFICGLALFLLPMVSSIASWDIVKTFNTMLPQILTVTTVHIMIVMAFILGVANALVFVPSNTLIQEKTSDEFRGRVYGTLNTMVGIFSLLPIIVVGELADIFGVARVIVGIGITIFLIGVFRLVFPKWLE